MALVLTDVADGVAVITLNDPARRNVLSLDMNAELIAAMDAVEADPAVRAIVVTGAPPVFSAGGHLDDLLEKRHAEGLREIYAGFLRVASSPLPTIAAVNGPAIGAGLNFVLACDVVLAARSARFDSRFLQIAIHPGGGHTWRLRNLTDLQTVKAMVLFNEVITAEDAARIGLAWRCVDDDALLDTARAMAAKCAGVPRELLVRTKATIQGTSGISSGEAAVELEIEPQAWSMNQPEFMEMTRAMKARISKG
jgi:enoyl-CoA hydratase